VHVGGLFVPASVVRASPTSKETHDTDMRFFNVTLFFMVFISVASEAVVVSIADKEPSVTDLSVNTFLKMFSGPCAST
jgi:hypothetical protein